MSQRSHYGSADLIGSFTDAGHRVEGLTLLKSVKSRAGTGSQHG
ncbi:MAG TPA: hypothetical protein VHS58_13370 [Acetobacteraceae bacterium]|nr:hypothetical protein [Acetobacteraceae bacterium]